MKSKRAIRIVHVLFSGYLDVESDSEADAISQAKDTDFNKFTHINKIVINEVQVLPDGNTEMWGLSPLATVYAPLEGYKTALRLNKELREQLFGNKPVGKFSKVENLEMKGDLNASKNHLDQIMKDLEMPLELLKNTGKREPELIPHKVVHPVVIIIKEMEARKFKSFWFDGIKYIVADELDKINQGKEDYPNITAHLAQALTYVLPMPSEFWLEAQHNYDEHMKNRGGKSE